MSREVCTAANCTTLSMAPGQAEKLLGRFGVGGLCKIHTLRAGVLMEANSRQIARQPRHRTYEPVGPYREWLSAVLESGTLTYRGLTLTDLTRSNLADVVGVHTVTVSKVVNGHTKWARWELHHALAPFVSLCSTEPKWSVSVGQHITELDQLKYVPPGTGVVDRYHRLWQYRAGQWAPAHSIGTTPKTNTGGPLQFGVPVRVVYLPPSLQNTTTP